MTDIARELEQAITAHTWARDEVPQLLKRAVREIGALRHSLATEMQANARHVEVAEGLRNLLQKYDRVIHYAFSKWPDGYEEYEGYTWKTGAAAGAELPPIAGVLKSDMGDIIARKADGPVQIDLLDE